MLKVLNRRTLQFSFPEVHEDAVLEIEFMRTFRVPDDGRLNALPPGRAPFEVDYVEKYPSKVPATWRKHEGLLLPMYQAEALWIDFVSLNGYPFAVKIGSGKLCAVTGKPWNPGLNLLVVNRLSSISNGGQMGPYCFRFTEFQSLSQLG